MPLHRYRVIDAYTLEELTRRYIGSDARGRIRLLKLLDRVSTIPQPLKVRAAKDRNVEVREWLARYGQLEQRPQTWFNGDYQKEANDEQVVSTLMNDPDPFVRACLRENTNIGAFQLTWDWGGTKALRAFQMSSHLERLALMRNESACKWLFQNILNENSTLLELQPQERRELAWAAIGGKALKKLRDDEKAEIFSTTTQGEWRRGVLWHCSEEDHKTIDGALKDPDDSCRTVAHSKFNPERYVAKTWGLVIRRPAKMHQYEELALKDVYEKPDIPALNGLAHNALLTVATLEKVRDILDEHKSIDAYTAKQTIDKIVKASDPDDAYKLVPSIGFEGMSRIVIKVVRNIFR
ncbi:MAG: hypothetical protein GDA68_16150 [Nitrospira sp. CR2.1]|nr:hypothetical protein [Nitrospira sp. CR2.1]